MQRMVDLGALGNLDTERLAALQQYLNERFQHGALLKKDATQAPESLVKETTFNKNTASKPLAFMATISHDLIAVEYNEEKVYYLIDEIKAQNDWLLTFSAAASLTKKNAGWHFNPFPLQHYCVTTTLTIPTLNDEQNLLLGRILNHEARNVFWQSAITHKSTLCLFNNSNIPMTVFFRLSHALPKRPSALNGTQHAYEVMPAKENASGRFSKVYLSLGVLKPTLFGHLNIKHSHRIIKHTAISALGHKSNQDAIGRVVKHLRGKTPTTALINGTPWRIGVEVCQGGEEGYDVYLKTPHLDSLSLVMLAIALVEACYEQTVLYGVVHRDISWSNVLIEKRGAQWKVNLVDYDAAKFIGDSDVRVEGTLYYISKESLCRDSKTESDIFSLGIMLSTLFGGSFDEIPESQMLVFANNPKIQGVFSDRKWPAEVREKVGPLLEKMIRPNWRERPNYQEIVAQLDEALLAMLILQSSLPESKVRCLARAAQTLRQAIRYAGMDKKTEVLAALSQTFPEEETAVQVFKAFLRLNAAWESKELATLKQAYESWMELIDAGPLVELVKDICARQAAGGSENKDECEDMIICLQTLQSDSRYQPAHFDEIENRYRQLKHWQEKAQALISRLNSFKNKSPSC